MAIQGSEIEISTAGGTTGQALIHDGVRFAPSSILNGLKTILANKANIVKPDGSRTYYDSYKLAQTASVSGDTIIAPANILDLTAFGNQSAVDLKPGVSLQTQGFQVGSTGTIADTITIQNSGVTPVKQYIQGGNSTVLNDSTAGNWTLGSYGGQTSAIVDFYEMRFKNTGTRNTCVNMISSGATWNFRDCSFDVSTQPVSGNGGGTIFINGFSTIPSWANFYNCDIKSSGAAVISSGVQVTQNYYNCNITISGALANIITNATANINFYGCTIDARGSTYPNYLMNGSTGVKEGIVRVINSTIISSATNTGAIQADTIVLEGTTTIIGALSYNTLTDNRQFALSKTYADNAAALAGGLKVNQIYKTTTGEVRIVV